MADAIVIGRDYLPPHAQAAFDVIGADPRTAKARQLWASSCRHRESAEYSESAPLRASRRALHQWNRRLFKTAEDLDPAKKTGGERRG